MESYEIFSVALDNVGDGVLVADPKGNVAMTNLSARLMLGVSEEGAAGWKVADLFSENGHLLDAYYRSERR